MDSNQFESFSEKFLRAYAEVASAAKMKNNTVDATMKRKIQAFDTLMKKIAQEPEIMAYLDLMSGEKKTAA